MTDDIIRAINGLPILASLNRFWDDALAPVAKIEIRRNDNPAMTTYESAERWNASNPPGTLVRVALRDGTAFEVQTAGYAQQWGELAIVALKGKEGTWTISALQNVR